MNTGLALSARPGMTGKTCYFAAMDVVDLRHRVEHAGPAHEPALLLVAVNSLFVDPLHCPSAPYLNSYLPARPDLSGPPSPESCRSNAMRSWPCRGPNSAAAKLRSAGLIPVIGDFADPVSLAAPAAQVDAIVSTASIGQVEGTPDSFAKDRDAVAVITKALRNSGKPLIFTSGSAIFAVFTKGEASPTIFDEDHPVPLPASVFAPPEV